MERNKKIIFYICLGVFIFITIFILIARNISENYNCSDPCKIIKYVADQENQSGTFTNITYAVSESCVDRYHKSNVTSSSSRPGELFEIVLNKHSGQLRSGRVTSVDQYKGDMMFIIDINSMSKSDIAFYAIWLFSDNIGEIDLMETSNKDPDQFSYSLIRIKNNQRISTQCEQNDYGLTSFRKSKYDHPHTLVFIKKGSNVTVYMNPIITYSGNNKIPTIGYTKKSKNVRSYDLDTSYDTINTDNNKKTKTDFKTLKDAEWKLIFNLEARNFNTKSYALTKDCKNKVYTKNNETASFKIGEVKYYNLDGKPNPAIPSDNPPTPPPTNCCILDGKDACFSKNWKCKNFPGCKDEDNINTNCCSKSSTLTYSDGEYRYLCDNTPPPTPPPTPSNKSLRRFV